MKHPSKNIEKRVAAVGCKHTTLDLIEGLARHGFAVDHCITLSPEKAREQEVAGYLDLRPFLEEKHIPYTVATKYSLKCEEDERALRPLNMDILLVMGWQRLIPEWLLDSIGIGAFGMHGSSRPLPHGRGRSPLNWSIIQNKNIFYTHLFRYSPGVDDGAIAGVQTFDITPFDTCHTLHLKNTVAMIQLCARHLPSLMDGTATLDKQPASGATYYPKRSAEDGLIFWTDSTLEIYNLVRAVTKPFPGAFSFLDDDPQQKVLIWKAMPFDTRLEWPGAAPGEIVEVFYDGSFAVKTADSTLLVLESEGSAFTHRDIGRKFGPAGTPRKVWENLPE